MSARTVQQVLESMLGAKDTQLAAMAVRIEELEEKVKELEANKEKK